MRRPQPLASKDDGFNGGYGRGKGFVCHSCKRTLPQPLRGATGAVPNIEERRHDAPATKAPCLLLRALNPFGPNGAIIQLSRP